MTASSFRLPTPPGLRRMFGRAGQALHEALLAVVRPSLVRRLLMAQLALLMLMWVIGIVHLLNQGGRAFLLLQSKQIYPTILAIADDAGSTPERRRHALDLLHSALVEDYRPRPSGSRGSWSRAGRRWCTDRRMRPRSCRRTPGTGSSPCARRRSGSIRGRSPGPTGCA